MPFSFCLLQGCRLARRHTVRSRHRMMLAPRTMLMFRRLRSSGGCGDGAAIRDGTVISSTPFSRFSLGTTYLINMPNRAPSGEKRDVILGTCGHPPLRVRWLRAQHIVFSWIWRRCWVKLHRSSAGDLPRGGVKSVRSRHCGAAGCSSVLKFARCLGRIPGILHSRPVSNRTRMYTRRRRSGGLLRPYLRATGGQSLSTASEVQD